MASPGTSVAASDDRRRSGGCYHLGERSFVFVVWAPITNHKPRASNDTDHSQHATRHQTANMWGGGAYSGLAKGRSACFKRYLDKKSKKVDTLGLNLMCLRTIVRVLLFIDDFIEISFCRVNSVS